jgi:hypothetical protein
LIVVWSWQKCAFRLCAHFDCGTRYTIFAKSKKMVTDVRQKSKK